MRCYLIICTLTIGASLCAHSATHTNFPFVIETEYSYIVRTTDGSTRFPAKGRITEDQQAWLDSRSMTLSLMNVLLPVPDSIYFNLPDGSLSRPIPRSTFTEGELTLIDRELERRRRDDEARIQAHIERLIFAMETEYGHQDARSIIVDNPVFDNWLDINPGYEHMIDSEDMKDVHIVLVRFKEYLQEREDLYKQGAEMASILRSEYGHEDVDIIVRSSHFWDWADSQPPEVSALADSVDVEDFDMILKLYKRIHSNYIKLIEVDTESN